VEFKFKGDKYMSTQPIAFSFTIDNFVIWQTRSVHEDTDFVTSTWQLQNADGSFVQPSHTITKSMGNVNNGTRVVNLTFPNFLVSPGQMFHWNYTIVNTGNASRSKVIQEAENVGNQLISTEAKLLITAGTAAGSLLGIAGTIAATVVGLIACALEGLLTANCDGPVAAEANIFTYDYLGHSQARAL
jgi:hypothetical protein